MAIKFPLINLRKTINGDWEQLETNQSITVPTTGDYIVHLDEVPDNGQVNARVTISGLTETLSYPPANGYFYVNYGTGRVAFNSAQAGNNYTVNYFAKGSLVEAEDINYLYDVSTSVSPALTAHIADYSETVHADPVTGLHHMAGLFLNGYTPLPSGLEGEIYWDNQNHTIVIDTGLGNLVQVGQEMFGVGTNKTGVNISATDLRVVYLQDIETNKILFDFADARYEATSNFIGVVTAAIPNNLEGPVTTFGMVNDVDTSAYEEGDWLWIAPNDTGIPTNVQPEWPNHAIFIGVVVKKNANTGAVFVSPDHRYHEWILHNQTNITALSAEIDSLSGDYVPITTLTNTHVPAGYLDYDTTKLVLVENVGAVNDTFSVTVSGNNFPIYLNGELSYLNSQTVTQVGALSQRYFIYFDNTGVLQISDVEWSLNPSEGFAGEAPTCTVLWDANGHQGILEEERHHSWRDVNWHHWAHHSVGPRYSFGHTADGFALTNPGADNYATFQILAGEIYDEDIGNFHDTTTTGNIFYHSADGTMTWEPTTTPYKLVAGVPQYDTGTGLANKLGNNSTGYFVTWVYATNVYEDSTYTEEKISFVVGQDTNNTMTLAEAQSVPLPVLPVGFLLEWKLIYKMIFLYTGGSAINWISNTDYRSSGSLPGAQLQSTNISAVSVSYTPTGTITSTNVQNAIAEVSTDVTNLTTTHNTDVSALSAAIDAQTTHYSISATPPSSATAYIGQQWYDTDLDVVYAWNTRSKWISTNRETFAFGSKDTPQNQYLNFYASGLASNLSGLRLLRNATITGITVQSTSSTTFDIEIRKNGSATPLHTASLVATDFHVDSTLDIDLDAADKLQIYLSSSGTIPQPMVLIELAWRQ